MYLALFFAVVGLVAVWHFRRQPGAGLSSPPRSVDTHSTFQFSKNMQAVFPPNFLSELHHVGLTGTTLTGPDRGVAVLKALNKMSKEQIIQLSRHATFIQNFTPQFMSPPFSLKGQADAVLNFASVVLQECKGHMNLIESCIASHPFFALPRPVVAIISPHVLLQKNPYSGGYIFTALAANGLRTLTPSQLEKAAAAAKNKNSLIAKAAYWTQVGEAALVHKN